MSAATGSKTRPVILALIRSVATAILLLAAYLVLLPINAVDFGPYLLLAGGVLMVGAALTTQLRAIVRASRADLRAIEAIGILLPLIVIAFAGVYLEMSQNNPANFTEPLTRVGSLYFAVTVLSSVGFGDISPITDAARLAVTLQMLADLVLVATVVRLIVVAIDRGRARSGD